MAVGTPGRGATSVVLVILAALALLGALVSGYASDAFFDSDEFADRAAAALDDEGVRAEVALRVTDDLVEADPDLVAVRPVIESAVSGVVGAGAFQGIFKTAARDVHRAIFQQDQNTVVFTLADIGTVVRGALVALSPKTAEQIGVGEDAEVTEIEPPDWVADLTQLAEDVDPLSWILLAVGVVLAIGAMWLGPDRRRTALALGISVGIAGVAAAVALGVVHAIVLAHIQEPDARDAADGIWDAFLGDLRTGLLLFAGCGAVVAAAASSLLRPVDVWAPLRRAIELIGTVPESPRMRVARALVLIAVGVIIVLRPQAAVELAAVLAGLYVAYAGVSELMRLSIAAGGEEDREAATPGGRALAVAGIAAGVITLGGTLFVAGGGTEPESPEIETVGCNGSLELCDRSLDQIAFPATHNAMSAATNPGWLFAQQDAGFTDQLRNGIRGLLIDAHYGQPTESGKVKTDLSDLSSAERATYQAELGEDALDAALRIRDRIVDSPPTGERQVYLCHRFCELGAISISDALREYRDFLAANPDEVLVIVIEDYVEPDDIAEAVEGSGLLDYVYTGPLTPLPTLQGMIDSGGRVLMLAENDAGDIPWYHVGYDELLQETPFSFKKPEELIAPNRIPASCEPNRGPGDAPLFLVNHWIDTSPAPKPSNAAKVNAHDPLLDRVTECEEIRGLTANLIAVDFYREGDLFEVAAELNSERQSASE